MHVPFRFRPSGPARNERLDARPLRRYSEREMSVLRRIFTYEEALALMPEVRRITDDAVSRVTALLSEGSALEPVIADERIPEYETIIDGWVHSIRQLGVEVKGLWLIDFDSGSGYYCWRYPEPALEYYHTYDEGFAGRVRLN